MSGPLMVSTNGWRKYSLVGRSQSLYALQGPSSDDAGILPLPPEGSKPRLQNTKVRVLSYRTLHNHTVTPNSTPNTAPPRTTGNRQVPARSSSLYLSTLPRPPPVRRRIPEDLFDALPESRIDPEPGEQLEVKNEDILAVDCSGVKPRAITLRVRSLSPDPLPEPESEPVKKTLLCRESPEGTLFGLLRTPTPVRARQHPPLKSSASLGSQPSKIHTKGGVTVVNIRASTGHPIQELTECFNQARNLPFGGQVVETVNPSLVRAFCTTNTMLETVECRPIGGNDPTSPWTVRPSSVSTRNSALSALPKPPLRWSSRPVMPTMQNGISGADSAGGSLNRTWSLQEPEVREAMRQLDLSIEDDLAGPVPPLMSGEVHSIENGPSSVTSATSAAPRTKEMGGEPENDNLIEEVFLSPGSDRRTYKPPSLASLSQPPSLTSQSPSLGQQTVLEYSQQEAEAQPENNGNAVSDESCLLEGAVVSSDRGSPSLTSASGQILSPDVPRTPVTPFFVVVAIDFGTTYSGYAFSFVRDPGKVHVMRKWEGGDPGVLNQKTPTCLLLSPEGMFHSFGFAARDFYHNMEPEEAQKWLYFEKFKMTLHNSQDLCRETSLRASNGRTLAALTVFGHALRYFREQALRELSDQSGTRILNEDIRWVVTVPAIWRQPAKQFMRTAAYQAGLATPDSADRLLIALEPEAASLYCRQLRLHQLVPETPPLYKHYLNRSAKTDEDMVPTPMAAESNTGTRYLVVDCGGGTVDMTLHELLDSSSGDLRELHKATGGPYGSVAVDAEFEKVLDQLFGQEFMIKFKKQRAVAFLDLMVAFEARKRSASPYAALPSNVALPFALIDAYKKSSGSSVETAIKKAAIPGVTWSSQGMLRLDPAALQRLFRLTLEGIKGAIASVLAHPDAQGAQYLFLVGGFAESPILQREIRDTFSPYIKVIIPQGVSLAILTGAVIFGLDPGVVRVRRSRLTYGVGVLHRFVHGTHPLDKRVVKDGVEWCADVLDPFVLADQSVALGDAVTRRYTPARPGQARIVLHLYCSDTPDARFVTDEGVSRCGTLVLELQPVKPEEGVTQNGSVRKLQRREIQMRMVLGDTEVKVSALDVTTGHEARAQIDFLSQ